MKKLFLIFLILVFYHSSALSESKQIAGNVERVMISDRNIPIDAKLDTGASMASLTAKDITLFKRDNKTWVCFTVHLPQQKIVFKELLVGTTHIVKRTEEYKKLNNKKHSTRFVIKMPICIGNQKKTILVNLVDREGFRYPLLIGSQALKEFNIIVDSAHQFIVPSNCQKTIINNDLSKTSI